MTIFSEKESIDVILSECILHYRMRRNRFREETELELVDFDNRWKQYEDIYWADYNTPPDLMRIRPSMEAALEEGLKYLRCARYCKNRILDDLRK